MVSERLSCESCGAELVVGPTTRFVTCARCHARLAVRRTESALYTELLAEDATPPLEPEPAINPQLEILRLQNELLRVDQEWAMKRDTMLVYGDHGYRSEPDIPAIIQGVGAMAVLIGVGLLLFVWQNELSIGTRLGLFFLVALVTGFVVLANYVRVKGYWLARTRYEKRRAALRRQLAELEQSVA